MFYNPIILGQILPFFLIFYLILIPIFSSEATLKILMYVRPYVCSSGLGGNVIFSGCNQDRGLIFVVKIRLTYEHLFCKHFFRRSAGLGTKGRNVKILKT